MKYLKKNKEHRSKVLRALKYCGRQGIALRGHRDDVFLFQQDHEYQNEGNFRELVRLMIDLDKDLEKFIYNDT